MLIPLRLKGPLVVTPFNRTELTIYEEFRESPLFEGDPGTGEAYVFVSCTGNQMLWVINNILVQNSTGRWCDAILTQRLRFRHGGFSDAMLQDYANELGYQLDPAFRTLREKIEEHRRAHHGDA